MDVAVGTGGDVVGLDVEVGLGGVAGIEELAVGSAVGQDLDPLDVVLLFHGVGDRADLDLDAGGSLLDNRDVLLPGGVNGVGAIEGHILSAADQGAGAAVEDLHDVSTLLALVDLQFFGHCKILSLKR